MAIRDPNIQRDGMVSFLGGQQAGAAPNLILDDQSAELWNCTRRSGHLRPRSGWKRRELEYESEEVEEWFTENKVQGTKIFKRYGTDEVRHIWSVGGRLFSIDIDGGSGPNIGLVKDITPTKVTSTTAAFTTPVIGGTVMVFVTESDSIQVGYPIMIAGSEYVVTSKSGSSITVENINATPATNIILGSIAIYPDVNDPTLDIAYIIQAEDFIIVQDGKSQPIIFDGSISRRSNTANKEVPTGTVMAYGRGRLWVAIGYGKFVASDILYGPTGTAAYDKRDAILKFTENDFISGGGAFSAPGEITAMVFASVLDTSTGQGPLLVFTSEAVVSVNAPTSRDLWASLQDPIQGISLLANGATGFYSTITTVNGDIFYRSIDGVRSFYQAIREFGTWGNTPISREIRNLTDGDDPNALKFCSAILFDNRLIFTGSSQKYSSKLYWRGLGVLDFDGITGIASKSPPAYDGIWSGVNSVWVYAGKYKNVERAFMAVINQDNLNELWEITKEDKFENGNGRIKWKWISRAFRFETPLEMKRLWNFELFPRNVVGEVDAVLKYRPDDFPCWFEWLNQSVCINYKKCTDSDCDNPPQNFRSGYKTRIPYGQPQDEDENQDGKPSRLGYTFQVSLELEGFCEIKFAILKAQTINESANQTVDQADVCYTNDCCEDDFFEWRSIDATESSGDV